MFGCHFRQWSPLDREVAKSIWPLFLVQVVRLQEWSGLEAQVGARAWACMENVEKIKDHDSMRPFRDQLKLCEGQVEQQGGVLVPQLIENLRPQFERMPPKKRYWSPRLSATVLSVVQTSFAAKRRTPTRLEKRSQPFVGLKLFTWITDISISQPEILWDSERIYWTHLGSWNVSQPSIDWYIKWHESCES